MPNLSLLYWTRTTAGFVAKEAPQPTMPDWLQSALLPQSGFFSLISVDSRCSGTRMHVRCMWIWLHDWRGRTSMKSHNQDSLWLRLAGRPPIMVDWELILIFTVLKTKLKSELWKCSLKARLPLLPYFIHALWNLNDKQPLEIPPSECLCVNVRIL